MSALPSAIHASPSDPGHFPAFWALAGRPVAVVGGGAAALQRVSLLLAAGARVTLFAEAPGQALSGLAAQGAITWLARPPEAADLAPAALAFVAGAEPAVAERAVALARAARVPVNVMDRPAQCDFVMPAIVRRGPVTIGVSTAGTAPALARIVRARIEAALPARLAALGSFARGFRGAVKAVLPTAAARRRFWDAVLGGPIGEAVLAGDERKARERMLAALNRLQGPEASRGAVYIIGAGPGDPELLTFRALRLMQQADIVLYDELAGPEVLDYVRREAERIHVGKTRGRAACSQDEINRLLLAHARAGRRVLRLKGGDPFVFGRGGEEVAFLRAHGVETVVVPGITAALGCAAAAGIPLTHRDHASAVTFVTGQGKAGAPEPNWRALVRGGQTLVVYMGLSVAGRIAARLVEAGLDPATPAAIVEKGTRPDQRVSQGRVRDLPVMAARHGGGPALLVIGQVAALADGFATATEWAEVAS